MNISMLPCCLDRRAKNFRGTAQAKDPRRLVYGSPEGPLLLQRPHFAANDEPRAVPLHPKGGVREVLVTTNRK